jgi:hypothetical protein
LKSLMENHFRCYRRFIIAGAVLASSVYCLHGQIVLSVSGPTSVKTDIPSSVAMSTFVQSNASQSQEALKSVAIGQAEGKVVGAVAGALIPIPILGAAAGPVVQKIGGLFHRSDGATKGFTVTYLKGLSSAIVVQQADLSFTVPAENISFAGYQPLPFLLVRLKPSQKDDARIIRTTHIAVKPTKSPINPVQIDLLGMEQDVVQYRTDTRGNGFVVLTPVSALIPGEYAILLPAKLATPMNANNEEAIIRTWDFRVSQ